MCDLGLVLGIATGAAQAVGQAQAANANIKSIQQERRLKDAANTREMLVEANASNKDAAQAALEGDRAKSAVITAGAGTQGSTTGLRTAEQGRQTALSIANAKDRMDASRANYALSGKNIQIGTQNQINAQRVNPLTAFTNIATSGMSSYGAFI